MEQSSDSGYQILGHIHYENGRTLGDIWGTQMLSVVNDLSSLVADGNVHQIVVSAEDQISEDLFHTLVHCRSSGIFVS